MSAFDKCFEKIFSLFRGIQVACIFAMSILVFLQIVLREVFGIGVQWVYELSCFMQISMVWLGVPVLLYKDSNIKITVLYDMCPPGLKRVLDFLRYGIYLCCVGFMAYGYVLYVQNLGLMKSSVLRLPNCIFYGALSIGIVMSILVVVIKAKRLLRLEKRPETSTIQEV